jgi:hypothetical protein
MGSNNVASMAAKWRNNESISDIESEIINEIMNNKYQSMSKII